jgi:hypothetical protein
MIQIKDKTKDNDFRKFNQFNNAGIFGDGVIICGLQSKEVQHNFTLPTKQAL